MHFTGLKIVGFKSFADPVNFAIREGLTGIVGPNGCGKSNILESLRWVMGATSARAMRGGEMDDLIFSGTSNRPQRENAEVALLLDNSERRAPAELNDSDELEVKRRLRRGAGSTYKINGRTVRAKDVQLLFADASTGANSPALVRQGQISELIASKPQNRRRILEEAAGIAGLNQRRHEAELKLRGASESLARLDEIIGEVDKQLNTLKRQAARAKKYRALQEQIEALELQIAFYKWQAAREEVGLAQKLVTDTQVDIRKTASEEANAAKAELELREQIPALRDKEAEASGQLGILKMESARLDGERKAAQDAILRLEKDLNRVVEDQAREHSLREEAITAANRAENTLASLPEDNAAQYEAEHLRLSRELSDVRKNLSGVELEYEQISQQVANEKAQATNAQTSLDRTRASIDKLTKEKEITLKNISALGDVDQLKTAQKISEKALKKAEGALNSQLALAEKSEAELTSAQRAAKENSMPLLEAEKNIRILEAEISGLKRLIGSDHQNNSAPILEDTHPDAGLERALAAALGDDLNASTNRNDSQFWSDRHGKSVSSLPVGATPLVDLVNAPVALAARLSQCGVVNAKDGDRLQAELEQGQRLVSKAGDLWRWDGFVRTAKAPSSASEKLEQRAKLNSLEKQLEKENVDIKKLISAKDKAEHKLEDAQSNARNIQKSLPELTHKVSQSKDEVLKNTQALERRFMRSTSFEDNLSRLEDTIQASEKDLKEAQTILEAQTSNTNINVLETLRGQLSRLREDERAKQYALSDLDKEKQRSLGRRSALQRELADWKKRSDTADVRLEELHSQRTGIRHQLELNKAAPSDISQKLDDLAEKLETAQSNCQHAADAVSVLESKLREAEQAYRQARDLSSKTREHLVRAETQLEAAQRRETDISDNIQARFDKSFDQLSKLASSIESEDENTPFDLLKAETDLAIFMRDRDSLGGVNMEADLQVEETADRLEAQLRERDDLDQAIAKLQEGVHALNAQGRELLLEAFEKVAEHFRVLFEALFEGGEAQLKLTESDDPLQAGLEIFASPPGKRLSALSLMSGGEQALTATALIFAVFLSQPSPLCVLDEVDAPLDDANVDRFCRMLETMRTRTDTRFVVITHNPVTMSRMDRLYGVTMQERGVSRLVSVDLQSAEQLVAAQ